MNAIILHAQQSSGPFGAGGDRSVAVKMEFFGNLGPDFLHFATLRANRLGLVGWIRAGGNRVLVHLEGAEALIGAFEMACCIGPDTAMVEDWLSSTTEPDTNLSGFNFQDEL